MGSVVGRHFLAQGGPYSLIIAHHLLTALTARQQLGQFPAYLIHSETVGKQLLHNLPISNKIDQRDKLTLYDMVEGETHEAR